MDWIKFFQISDEKLYEFKKQKPIGMDLLLWCLETGKIKEEDYLNWAKDHYKIPILKESYFQKIKA